MINYSLVARSNPADMAADKKTMQLNWNRILEFLRDLFTLCAIVFSAVVFLQFT